MQRWERFTTTKRICYLVALRDVAAEAVQKLRERCNDAFLQCRESVSQTVGVWLLGCW